MSNLLGHNSVLAPDAYKSRGLIGGFLIWLKAWLGILGDEPTGCALPIESPNRYARRTADITVSSVRYPCQLRALCRKGLSPTQFAERLCALSLLGRISVYQMRFWNTSLQKHAVLGCCNHGQWRVRAASMGSWCCGMWHAHLRPF